MISANSEQITSPAPISRAALLKQVRQLHLYLGVFFAPAIIFFSFTGALQLFGLHEGHPGEAYQPPKWIEALASIHKDQVLSKHHGPPQTPGMKRPPEGPRASGDRKEQHERTPTLILKWFFLGMSIGLAATTLLGIYMAFKYNRSRVLVWGLLTAGAAIPSALIALLA